jgi:hypothetical protein
MVEKSSDTDTESNVWQYGFPWGPMTVQRLVHVEDRGYVLEVETKYQALQVYVSEKGRVIKTYPRKK